MSRRDSWGQYQVSEINLAHSGGMRGWKDGRKPSILSFIQPSNPIYILSFFQHHTEWSRPYRCTALQSIALLRSHRLSGVLNPLILSHSTVFFAPQESHSSQSPFLRLPLPLPAIAAFYGNRTQRSIPQLRLPI